MKKRDWGKWALAALVRAVKTFFQSFCGFLVVGATMQEIPWIQALSVSGVAFILSICTSLAGIPEEQVVEQKPPAEEKQENG